MILLAENWDKSKWKKEPWSTCSSTVEIKSKDLRRYSALWRNPPLRVAWSPREQITFLSDSLARYLVYLLPFSLSMPKIRNHILISHRRNAQKRTNPQAGWNPCYPTNCTPSGTHFPRVAHDRSSRGRFVLFVSWCISCYPDWRVNCPRRWGRVGPRLCRWFFGLFRSNGSTPSWLSEVCCIFWG